MIKAIHFLNNGGGGTLSVVQNILRFSKHTEVEHHVIYTVNKDIAPGFTALNLAGAASEQVFFYSANWNFYYTCRQLAAMLPSADAVIIAHDWIELGMASMLGLPNPLVQLVHGNYSYYFDLAKKNESVIDRFIAVSQPISDGLKIHLPTRIKDISYSRFPVPEIPPKNGNNAVLKIVYAVRSLNDKNKQFDLLPAISRELADIQLHWTILGDGIVAGEVKQMMGTAHEITVFPFLPNDALIRMFPEMDIFLLPSIKEGFPVTLVEAMKAGVVPLVTNWGGAAEKLVIDDVTGYYLEISDAVGYADKIRILSGNRNKLSALSDAASKTANDLFHPQQNTNAIEAIIQDAFTHQKTNKQALKVYGSRLDQKWIPNKLTSLLRTFTKKDEPCLSK
jgi:glycosyltransferase involved in cell wall biosynthesis